MVCRLHKRMRRSLSAMQRRFRDSRSRTTASTTKAPLLCQRIPVAAFSRGADVLGIAPPTPKLNVFMRPLNTSEPHLQLLGGFAGQISPKRHPASAFPQVGEADREHSPAENCAEVQSSWQNRRPFPAKPPRIRRGATAGKAAAAVSANAGATRSIAGASAGEAAAADAHVAKRILAPDAPQTVARKRL